VLVLATETSHPMRAVEYLAEHLSAIRNVLAAGKAILVQSGGVQVFELEDLLSERLGA
jgi:queuine/archaeosine tRNA-ribosyltransferase